MKHKYNVGDKVRIKSIDWYNVNKNKTGNVPCREYDFVSDMSVFCGKILTIDIDFEDGTYLMKEDTDGFVFADEMIEGLVEEESNIDLTVKGEEVKERIEITIPEGYEYVIESGKIIFTKKKKEYPKTYEECCEVLGYEDIATHCIFHTEADERLFDTLYSLKVCRDAYWKIAGEEIGLGKPWENSRYEVVYGICRDEGNIVKLDDYWGDTHIFEFPIREMRDAFKENFDPDIEICKEFL